MKRRGLFRKAAGALIAPWLPSCRTNRPAHRCDLAPAPPPLDPDTQIRYHGLWRRVLSNKEREWLYHDGNGTPWPELPTSIRRGIVVYHDGYEASDNVKRQWVMHTSTTQHGDVGWTRVWWEGRRSTVQYSTVAP